MEPFVAGVGEVVRKPVHVREILSTRRRDPAPARAQVPSRRLRRDAVHFDGKGPGIDLRARQLIKFRCWVSAPILAGAGKQFARKDGSRPSAPCSESLAGRV
jgi:hypothetical protein